MGNPIRQVRGNGRSRQEGPDGAESAENGAEHRTASPTLSRQQVGEQLVGVPLARRHVGLSQDAGVCGEDGRGENQPPPLTV